MKVGRVGHSAILIKNKDLYVVGGYNTDNNEWLKSVEMCPDVFEDQNPKWQPMAEMHEARFNFGACNFKNE